MMKNIRFYTIAVLFGRLLTPKVNRCLYMDIRYSTFDIGSHVISCLRESLTPWSTIFDFCILRSEDSTIQFNPSGLTTYDFLFCIFSYSRAVT